MSLGLIPRLLLSLISIRLRLLVCCPLGRKDFTHIF